MVQPPKGYREPPEAPLWILLLVGLGCGIVGFWLIKLWFGL
jgi:hypothetical protein